jgi:hypothetical protein
VHWAPGIPRSPLGVAPRPLRGEEFLHNSGASRRGNAKLQLAVIASEAKQPILCATDWIASLRSQWRC